jgi:hypothetical protein
MAIRRKEIRLDQLPRVIPPIKYLTENGFSIVRVSEIDPSVSDTPRECRFLVQTDQQSAREIWVSFGEELITQLRIRRRMALPDTSMFWLVCAETCLANYLWQENDYPPGRRLIINELSPDELMLAIYWRDESTDKEHGNAN